MAPPPLLYQGKERRQGCDIMDKEENSIHCTKRFPKAMYLFAKSLLRVFLYQGRERRQGCDTMAKEENFILY